MQREIICDICGSKYQLIEHSIAFRDKDSIECEVCGKKLISWNGGCVWTSKLLEKGTIPFTEK